MADPHNFDRRAKDVNYEALRVQFKSLQEHVHEQMMPELRANSHMTKQLHEAVFGRGDEVGLSHKVEEVHSVLLAAKGGFAVLETIGKVAKPLLYAGALVAALYGMFSGHDFQWPKL